MEYNLEEIIECFINDGEDGIKLNYGIGIKKFKGILKDNEIDLSEIKYKRKEKIKDDYSLNKFKGDISEVYSYYKTHSLGSTANHYHLKDTTLARLFNLNNFEIIERTTGELKELANRNRELSCLEKYGVTNVSKVDYVKEKISQVLNDKTVEEWADIVSQCKETKLKKYGDPLYNNRESAYDTCIERYGMKSYSQCEEGRNKIKENKLNAKIEKWSKINKDEVITEYKDNSTHFLANKYHMHTDVFIEYLNWAGIDVHSKEFDIKLMNEKIEKLCMDRYGKPAWGLGIDSQVKNGVNRGNQSGPEKKLGMILKNKNIEYSKEFYIDKKYYDFKIGDILIELNPSATHNSQFNPFNKNSTGLDKNYHFNKTKAAEENGYRCIHIFDWEDQNKIIDTIVLRDTCYARNCEIKLVGYREEKEFLDNHHIQNYTKSKIAIGLYLGGKLISIMTFGKPRYNKNYEWELIRYCSVYNIVGGPEKIFKYFINNYNPTSVISYCDRSKFMGKTYEKIGFTLNSISSPRRHWFNIKTGKHITENLLLKRGYDQLFGTNFGKEFTNEELMLSTGFVDIYDCGQATYIWKETDNE